MKRRLTIISFNCSVVIGICMLVKEPKTIHDFTALSNLALVIIAITSWLNEDKEL